MRFRGAYVAVSIALVAALLSACGGSGGSSGGSDNGVASKSAEAILAATTAATSNLSALHMSGSLTSNGTPITLDLYLVSGKGATGTLSENGLSFKLISVGKLVFINGSAKFWEKFGGKAAATLFNGKWLKTTTSSPSFGSLAALTNLHDLFGKLLGSHGALKKAAATTIDGQKVIGLTDTAKGGTLYVATTGKPYPVQLTSPKPGTGHITFSGFNQPVSITAPSSSVDISQLTGG